MSRRVDAAQRRADAAKAAALAARERVEKETDARAREKARAAAQKKEFAANRIAQKAKLLLQIEKKEISKNEARRIEATRRRHQGYDFLKTFLTIGKKENPCTREETVVRHGESKLRNKGRAFLGGTKPMYEYEDLGRTGKTWLFKEAVNCVGLDKPAGALVSRAAYLLQQKIDPASAIETFVEKSPDGKRVLGSFQERVQVDSNAIDLFKWQADAKAPLPASLTRQILREHATDWLLCNYDTKGENFVIDTDGRLRGIDKEQAFRFLGEKKAQTMSHDYSPNPNETLYDTVFKKYSKGELELDLRETTQYIRRIEAMKKEDYIELFREAVQSTCKGDKKRQEEMEAQLLARKLGLRNEYRNFYTAMIHERYRENAAEHLGPDQKFAFADEKDLEHTAKAKVEEPEKEPVRQAEHVREKAPSSREEQLQAAVEKTVALARDIAAFPLGDGLEQAFPSVDPHGKHSRLDLDLAQRMAAVRARLPLCASEIQAEVGRLETIPGLARAQARMEEESMQYGVMEHASRHGLAALPQGQRAEAGADIAAVMGQIQNTASVRICDAYLTQLEHLTGLRKEAPAPGQTALLQEAGLLAHEGAVKQAGQRGKAPDRLSVPFENSENWAWRRYLLQAAEKGEGALADGLNNFRGNKGARAGLVYEEPHLQAYADATVRRVLDPLFEGMQEKHPALDPNDFIFIDGKSMKEVLTTAGVDPNSPEAAVESRLRLTFALQTDRRVRAYLPDPDTGEPSRQPTVLTREGYEPSPLNKPHMNAWERFWSKKDFYKEKSQQLEKYTNEQSMQAKEAATVEKSVGAALLAERIADCRDIVEKPVQQRKEFEDSLHAPAMKDGTYFRTARSTATFAACLLLRQHDLEAILDPTQLVQEKIRAGQEVVKLRQRDDPAEFAALVLPAAQKLVSRPDPQMDYGSLHSYGQATQELVASQLLFEMNQEMSHVKDACRQYCKAQAGDPALGERQFENLLEQSSNRGNFYSPVIHGAQMFARNAGYPPERVLEDELCGVAAMDVFLKQQEKGHKPTALTPLKKSSGIRSEMIDPEGYIDRTNKKTLAGPIMEGKGGLLFHADFESAKERTGPVITCSALHAKLSADAKKATTAPVQSKSAGKAR